MEKDQVEWKDRWVRGVRYKDNQRTSYTCMKIIGSIVLLVYRNNNL